MYSSVFSGVLHGIMAEIVRVEADVGVGIPSFEMSGFLSSEVKEARERVKVAVRNCGYELSPQKIVVNISPADMRKDGTGFDLPIALAVLAANGLIDVSKLSDTIVLGELSLDGGINGVRGVLPCICKAKEMGYKRVIIPVENANEGAIVEGICTIPVKSLSEAAEYINRGKEVERRILREHLKKDTGVPLDFSDIRGQRTAKRAAMIAAAGMHNIMFVGPPGSGKTMIAKRIPTILPEMTFDEKLEVTNIYSIAGQLGDGAGLIGERPFRAPYHTVTRSAFFGGGMYPRPGEVSLAGNGVLFLDEMTEFRGDILEGLRQPLEDRKITISRLNYSYTFPADFMLVGAMNPCKCGYYPDRNRCRCREQDIRRFLGKISTPLWDRFDMSIRTEEASYEDLQESRGSDEMTSALMRQTVMRVKEIQKKRFSGVAKDGGKCITFNAQMDSRMVARVCRLTDDAEKLMKMLYAKKRLTGRGYHKILKVARTIADIEGHGDIEADDVSEAFCYKGSERSTDEG